MANWREGANKYVPKRVHPFPYDIVPSTFDIVCLENKGEILALKNMEAGDHLYFLDSEIMGEDAKWLETLGIFWRKRLYFLSSLTLNQQMTTLLCLIFKDKQIDNYNVFSTLEDIK